MTPDTPETPQTPAAAGGLESQVRGLIESAVSRYLATCDAAVECPAIELGSPRNPDHGDWSSNVAMKLAKGLKQKPRDIAEGIIGQFPENDLVDRPEVAGPGFINLRAAAAGFAGTLRQVLASADAYGNGTQYEGRRALVEFVSANPTGPLHIGHGRNAVVGDVLSRIYAAAGYDVEREYYFNDAGVQMRLLGETLRARYLQACGEDAQVPENGYRGDYMIDIARQLHDEEGTARRDEEDTPFFTHYASEKILTMIRADLATLGIEFDTYFSETSLHEGGQVERTLGELQERGCVYEQDGALWLKTTDHGDDKDRVVRKSDGDYTYLTPDIAYHRDKFERGFDRLVNVLGGDHHGYVARLKAAIGSLGHDPEALHCVLIQMVSVKREGKIQKLSTRAGDFIPLRDVLEDLGPDVVRFFFVMRGADSQMTFDFDLAKQKSMDNPYYYVQYAHARCRSLMRKAEESGQAWRGINGAKGTEEVALERLTANEEKAIIRQIEKFPKVISEAANRDEPLPVTNYLRDLATAFHSYFSAGNKDLALRCIQANDPEMTQARLTLIAALQQTLANGLGLLGIKPLERL